MSDTMIDRNEIRSAEAPRRNEAGMALLTVLLLLTLMSALMAGFLAAVMADQKSSGIERDQTQAYAAAQAGLEKLTSDLAQLFVVDFSPDKTQLAALETRKPSISGFQFVSPLDSGYAITYKKNATTGNPEPESDKGTNITAGPYQGFKGVITPYDLTVTARSASGGSEVRLRRSLQTVSVPVFQFGIFSDGDLSFYGGDSFKFGGLVHTNGNLFLAEIMGEKLSFTDRITAKEVIRAELSNGYPIKGSIWSGTVEASTGASVRALAVTEGSLIGGPGTKPNEPAPKTTGTSWTTLSQTTYAGYIRSQATGAKKLDLPLVQAGAEPIDLIRRPLPNEDVARKLVFGQRYFSQASVRILLSDKKEDILNLPTVTADEPIQLGFLNPTTGITIPGYSYSTTATPTSVAPFAASGGPLATGTLPASMYLTPKDTPLLGGYIKIEAMRTDNKWYDVTLEILNLGITGRNLSNYTLNVPSAAGANCNVEPYPNAIIRLQRFRDKPISATYQPCGMTGSKLQTAAGVNVSPDPADYWPNALYDTREGNFRDTGKGTTTMTLNGIMHYVEFDVNNFRKWLAGTIPGTGTQVLSNNGYIVYFSDRRGNRDLTGKETGEYGFEDNLNPGAQAFAANNVLDKGEDHNGNGTLEKYGEVSRAADFLSTAPMDALAKPWTTITGASAASVARVNRPVFFRRALKLVNGAVGNLPAGGFTVTSENPVYVQGDYNATAASTTAAGDVAAAIVADAVTVLSNNWNDIRSFTSPNDRTPSGTTWAGRMATTTGYRFAVAAGKTPSFPRPTWDYSSPTNYLTGTDGGVGNFLRYIEDWNNGTIWVRYRGSIVSLFTSRQATSAFKCCVTVYEWSQRDYQFDTKFLLPTQLPPGTPMFRDVNTLTFRQLLRPTQ